MFDSLKKKVWLATGLFALLIGFKFLFSDKTESPVQAPLAADHFSPSAKKPAVPVAKKVEKSHPKIPNNKPVFKEKAENVREEYVGDEDKSEKRNFILCEHIISGQSQNGFSGEIRLINKGFEAINGWSVQWEYEDGATIVAAEDVALGGNNPYTGEYLSHNAEIPPGKTVKFRFSGIKGGDMAPMKVKVTGEYCI